MKEIGRSKPVILLSKNSSHSIIAAVTIQIKWFCYIKSIQFQIFVNFLLQSIKCLLMNIIHGRARFVPPPPIPGVSRVEVLPVLGFVLSGDLSVGHHLPETLGSCSRSLYAVCILKAHGLPISSLHEVTRATVLARLLYDAPAWRGFAPAPDCSRIDRFITRTVNLGYLSADCPTFNALVNTAKDRLLFPVIRNSYHVLRPLSPLSSPDDLTPSSEPIHLSYL